MEERFSMSYNQDYPLSPVIPVVPASLSSTQDWD